MALLIGYPDPSPTLTSNQAFQLAHAYADGCETALCQVPIVPGEVGWKDWPPLDHACPECVSLAGK